MRLRLHWELAKAGWRRQLAYRAATVAGLFTNSVFGFVQASVLLAAIHAAGRPIGGYDAAAAVTYAWLAQAAIGPLDVFGGTELADRVQTGDIATDFARPVDLLSWNLAVDYGRAGASTLFRGVPQVLVGAIFFRLLWPSGAAQWLAVVLSLTLAVAVAFGLRFLASLLVFWTMQRRGVWAAHTAVLLVLSGFILPLAFYPHWAATLLRALPWASAVQAPIDVFLDRRPWPGVVALQLAWAAALVVIGRFATRAAHRRLVVQGG